MTIETTIAIASFVLAASGAGAQAMYMVRRITQSETQIKNDIQSLGTSTTASLVSLSKAHEASMSRLEDTTTNMIVHHNEISGLKTDELNRRVGRIEETINKITKVVVFGGTA